MEPDLTLQMLKSWHDPRTVPWLELFGRVFGKLWRGSRSSVIAKFCEWGVFFMRNRTMPPDAYMTQGAVEGLLRACEGMDFPATSDRVVGPGLAAEQKSDPGARRPRIDPFHLILEMVSRSFKQKPRREFTLARSRKGG